MKTMKLNLHGNIVMFFFFFVVVVVVFFITLRIGYYDLGHMRRMLHNLRVYCPLTVTPVSLFNFRMFLPISSIPLACVCNVCNMGGSSLAVERLQTVCEISKA